MVLVGPRHPVVHAKWLSVTAQASVTSALGYEWVTFLSTLLTFLQSLLSSIKDPKILSTRKFILTNLHFFKYLFTFLPLDLSKPLGPFLPSDPGHGAAP